MDAAPILARIAEAINRHRLEAILVGDAAAALHGSPVATLAIEFELRRTPKTVRKLEAMALELDGTLLDPYRPDSDLMRIALDGPGLQIDFLETAVSFEDLRERASELTIGGATLLVACLEDVIGRQYSSGATAARIRELADRDMIRRWQARPPEQRTHFLRVRVGICSSCL